MKLIVIKVLIVLNLILTSMVALSFVPYTSVDSKLSPYYERAMGIIESNCKPGEYNRPRQISVRIANDLHQEESIGQCLNLSLKYIIEVKNSYWEYATEDQRYSLIFHEVAHCALDVDHNADPTHYMYYMENHLDYETVLGQFTNDVLVSCSRNRRVK